MARYRSDELTFAEQRRVRVQTLVSELDLGNWDDERADTWFVHHSDHHETGWQTYSGVLPPSTR